MQKDQFVLTSDAARILGVSSATVRNYAIKGLLATSLTPRGVRLFDRASVERLAREREAGAAVGDRS
jgi:DNA-binding transcriptional MerR regulator